MYETQLRGCAAAVEITSPTSFSWFGHEGPELSSDLRELLPAQEARNFLTSSVAAQLYTHFYCRGGAAPVRARKLEVVRPRRPLRAELAAANSGLGHWQPGWRVLAPDSSGATVTDGVVRCWAESGLLRSENGALGPGAPVDVSWPPGSASASAGFYVAYGDTALVRDDAASLLRLYWHVRPSGAVRLMRLVTTFLNQQCVPFSFKVASDVTFFDRCDTGVLYLRRDDYQVVRECLAKVHVDIADHLSSSVPALTRRTARGVGLAEGPSDGRSFGKDRCALIAGALVDAYDMGVRGVAGKYEAIVAAFADAGLDVRRPFLSAGSEARYPALEVRTPPTAARVQPTATRPQPLTSTYSPGESPRDIAWSLARDLAAAAIWHGNRCTWLEPTIDGQMVAWSVSRTTMGASLYDGCAGVGLFLAECAGVTGDERLALTAEGALRQAFAKVGGLPDGRRDLYTGGLGVAAAAARGGLLLGRQDLVSEARRVTALVLGRGRGAVVEEFESDLLTGDAGTIVALLTLAELLDDQGLVKEAEEVATRLLRRTRRSGEGVAWPSAALPAQPPLTGLSHGAAGVAYALALLDRRLGTITYRDVVSGALRYEDGWFDEQTRTLADLRDMDRGEPRPARPWPSMMAWCHGTPGSALARLTASEVYGDPGWRCDGVTYLDGVRDAVRSALAEGYDDFSPCHGLSGLAEVVLVAGQVLGADAADDLPQEVARAGWLSHGKDLDAWPGGMPIGGSVSLFLGAAGIGRYYLRLADPSLPSLLMPDPVALARVSGKTPHDIASGLPQVEDRLAPTRTQNPAQAHDGERVGALVANSVRSAGMALEADRRASIDARRWELGRRLRDEVWPRRFPDYLLLKTHVDVAETDPHLWNSLPYMLAFGYEQAQAVKIPPPAEDGAVEETAAWAGAVFSALLSVFDYLVDETPLREAVYDLEEPALTAALHPEHDDVTLARALDPAEEPRIRLLLSLFGCLRRTLQDAPPGDDEARTSLLDVLTRLFAAQRKVTLTNFVTAAQMREVLPDAAAKSVLPFEALARLAALTRAGHAPKESLCALAQHFGSAMALADDVADLSEDLRCGSPNQVALRAEGWCGDSSTPPRLDELRNAIDEAVKDLEDRVEQLRRVAAEQGLTYFGAFAEETVLRWMGVDAMSGERHCGQSSKGPQPC